MTTPVAIKPIFPAIPARALTKLKGLTNIESFDFGKNTLKPAMIELFKKQGIEIGDIQLDQVAKARLMGMMNPSFKEMVDQGKSAAEIFSYLELSLFSTEPETGPRTLYLLGDKDNNRNINVANRTPKNRPATSEAPSTPAIETRQPITMQDKIAALTSLLQEKVAGRFMVVEQGQLPALSKIKSMRGTDPVLNGKMSFYLEEYFDIRLTEIITDEIGQAYLAAERPSYPDKVDETKGNLAVDGHLVVFVMQNRLEARLYLLKDPTNIAKLTPKTSKLPRAAAARKAPQPSRSEKESVIKRLKDLGAPIYEDEEQYNRLLSQNITALEELSSRLGLENLSPMLYLLFSSTQPGVRGLTLKGEISAALDSCGFKPFLTFLQSFSRTDPFSVFSNMAWIITQRLPRLIPSIKSADDLDLFLSLVRNGIDPSPNLFSKAQNLTLKGELLSPALIKTLKKIERKGMDK